MQAVTRPTLSEARLESVLQTAPDGIIVIDEAGRILVFNQACEAMFGHDAAEMIGMDVSVLMGQHHAERHGLYLQRYHDTGERRIPPAGREVEGRRSDGTLFPMDLSIGEATTPNGRQFIAVIRDLTEHHETERRLAEAQADLIRMARISALDEMGSALAHELNQPLTAMMLYLQALGRELDRVMSALAPAVPAAGQSRLTDILGRATREASRAGAIIQRVRQLVEKRAPDRKVIDVDAVIDDALELSLMGRKRRLRLNRKRSPEPALIEADPVQIQQVILNLTRNALEAMAAIDLPCLGVTVARDADQVTVAVSDNGPGIPPERLDKLFQAFNTASGQGMGIGLTISRAIIQNHLGELVVDPGGNGRGACFTIRLPAAADQAQDMGERASVMPHKAAAEQS